MALNRRQFLIGAGGLAAAATTMGLAACAPGSSGSGSQGGGGQGGANNPPAKQAPCFIMGRDKELVPSAALVAKPDLSVDRSSP